MTHADERAGEFAAPAIAVLGLMVVGFALRVAGIDQGIFADELSTLQVATGADNPGDVIDLVRADTPGGVVELTPPLFFVLSWASAQIGDPTIWQRLPQVIAGVLMIPAAYAVGVRTVGRGPALLGAALVTLSPFLIFYSQDARSYVPAAFMVLVATLTLLLALERGRWWWGAYALASVACLYTSYTTAPALLAQCLWALWAYRDRWRPLLAANVVAAIAFLPWLGEFFDDGRSPYNFLPLINPLTLDTVLTDFADLTVGTPVGDRSELPWIAGWILIAAGLLVAAAAIAPRPMAVADPRPPGSRRGLALVAIVGVGCPLGLIVWSLFGTTVFDSRNLTPSLPFIMLGASAVLLAPRPLARAVATGLVVAGFALGGLATLLDEHERPQVRKAAEYALSELEPGQPIYAVENADYGGIPGPLERSLAPYVPDADLRAAAEAPPPTLPADGARAALVVWHAGDFPGVSEEVLTEPALPPGWRYLAERNFTGIEDIQVRIVGPG